MEHWDPQIMLDLYIHNYLIRKNMHSTAEIFAREANVYPKAVAIDSPDGFLSEWWSLFWSVYSSRCPNNTEAPPNAVDGPQNAHPAMQSPEANYMLQNVSLAMQRPGLPNLLQTVLPTTIVTPHIGNFLQPDLSSMMSRPEMEVPVSDFTMMQEQAMQNLIAGRMSEQLHAGLPPGDLNSGPQLLNVNQLAGMHPSFINPSHLQEKVYKNPQLSFTRDDICATSLRRFATDPTRHLPKPIQFELGSAADTGLEMREQEHLSLAVQNLTSNHQILDVDRFACLLPSSSNCSLPQERVYTNLLLSADRDDERGCNLWGPIAAGPYCHPPNPIQFNFEPANTDTRMNDQEFLGLPVTNLNSNMADPYVGQLAPLLPSSSNYSHPQKTKKKRQRQRPVTRGGKSGSSLRRSIVLPTQYAPISIQPKSETVGTDAKKCEHGSPVLPVRNLNSSSQLVDVNQLALLLSSSSNYSEPQRNDDKRSQLSLATDEKCGTSLRTSIAKSACYAPKAIQAKPDAPKAIQSKPDLANAGSSTSSNSASSDPSSRVQELMQANGAA